MSGKTDRDDRDDSKTAAIAAAVLGAILSLGAASMYDGKTAMSVALGAAIAVANLLTMRAIVRALLPPTEDGAEEDERKDERDHREAGRRGGAAWGVFAILKLFVLFGGIWLLLTKGLVAPIPLVVGYGVLPLGIAAAGLWNGLKTRR